MIWHQSRHHAPRAHERWWHVLDIMVERCTAEGDDNWAFRPSQIVQLSMAFNRPEGRISVPGGHCYFILKQLAIHNLVRHEKHSGEYRYWFLTPEGRALWARFKGQKIPSFSDLHFEART